MNDLSNMRKQPEFSDWYNEFIKQTADIILIAEQIDILKQQVKNAGSFVCCADIIYQNIQNLLLKWVGSTYIGFKKPVKFKNAFQQFFISLYDLLIVMKNSDNKNLNNFANRALYQGTVYRYIGYTRHTKINKGIVPEYNDIYVSWSKNSKNSYIESKLNGTITHMTCNIFGDVYGIDLSAFGVRLNDESEVVFPTVERYIINIDYIKK